jgi:tRNA wybutosine-synthesizing protein 3
MISEKDFNENKKNALFKFEKEKKEKKVDIGIVSILDIINNCDDYYTSSSCFGRIVLLEIPVIGDKKNARFLGKWHQQINQDDILTSSKYAKQGQIWILAQSPIIHVSCRSNMVADKLLKMAVACGFKHSGLKSFDKNIVIEITSTERLDAPVGIDGQLFCNDEYLGLLVGIANEVIDKSSLKLVKLKEMLDEKL